MARNRFNPGGTAGEPTGDVPAPTVRALLRAVRDAEVLYIAFPRLQRAIIIDTRPGEPAYPAALVATLAFGAGGQAAAAEKLRPGRPPSDRSIATTWGGSTRAFADQGVLAAIIATLPPQEEAGVLAAFAELQAAEGASVPSRAVPPPPSDPTRYQPIADHLATVAEAAIMLPLAEIEGLIGGLLPLSAHTDPRFWTAPKSAHVRALHRQGWRARLDARHRCVHFTRYAEEG